MQTMPFGKHQDEPLDEIPRPYLGYVLGFDNLSPGLRAAIRVELAQRGLAFGKHKGVPLPDVPTDYLRWLVGSVELLPPYDDLVRDELEDRGEEVEGRRHGFG